MDKTLKEQLIKFYGSIEAIPEELLGLIEESEISSSSSQEYEPMGSSGTEESSSGELEAYTQALNEASQKFIEAKTVEDLFETCIKIIQTEFSFYYTQLLRFNPAVNNLILIAGTGEIGQKMIKQGFNVQIPYGPIGSAADQKRTLIIPDVPSSHEWDSYPELELSKSSISIPVLFGNNLIGVIDAHSQEFNAINSDIKIALEILSGHLAVAHEGLKIRSDYEDKLSSKDTLSDGYLGGTLSPGEGKAYSYDLMSEEAKEIPLTQENGQPKNEFDQKGLIKIPMSVRGEVIGSLGIQEDPDNPLTDEEQQLLESITVEVAEALERARLFETSKRSAAELAVLNDMGNDFSESLDVNSIIENIFVYSKKLVEIHDFFIAIYDFEEDQITFPLAIDEGTRVNKDHEHFEHWQPRPGKDGLTGHILQTRQPILIANNAADVLKELGMPVENRSDLVQSWVGVPLSVGDRSLGVISAQSETVAGLYNQHDVELLSAVASQAAIAIDNARLLQQEQERAKQENLVRTITEKVRSGSDTKEILQFALEELSQILNAENSVVRLGSRDQLVTIEKEPVSIEEQKLNGHAVEENGTHDING